MELFEPCRKMKGTSTNILRFKKVPIANTILLLMQNKNNSLFIDAIINVTITILLKLNLK